MKKSALKIGLIACAVGVSSLCRAGDLSIVNYTDSPVTFRLSENSDMSDADEVTLENCSPQAKPSSCEGYKGYKSGGKPLYISYENAAGQTIENYLMPGDQINFNLLSGLSRSSGD